MISWRHKSTTTQASPNYIDLHLHDIECVQNRNAHIRIAFADQSSSFFPKVANMRDVKGATGDVLTVAQIKTIGTCSYNCDIRQYLWSYSADRPGTHPAYYTMG